MVFLISRAVHAQKYSVFPVRVGDHVLAAEQLGSVL
jgi:hypothetical protein